MNNKGQSVMSEYMIIFFVVIAVAVGMTTFVQRGLEGRVHDARNYMIDTVINSGACDAACMNAAGGNIFYEYEPYYALTLADTEHNAYDSSSATKGNPAAIGAIYTQGYNEATVTNATSTQLPPCASLDPVPAWCNY